MNYAIESMDLTDFIQTDMKRNIRQKIPGTEKVLFRDHRTVNVVSFSSDLLPDPDVVPLPGICLLSELQ